MFYTTAIQGISIHYISGIFNYLYLDKLVWRYTENSPKVRVGISISKSSDQAFQDNKIMRLLFREILNAHNVVEIEGITSERNFFFAKLLPYGLDY
jgi:ribonuclease P protein component